MPEKLTVEYVPQPGTPGTDTQDAHEPKLSSPDILALSKRQNEMEVELQQQGWKLDVLLSKSHKDLAHENNKGQGIQVSTGPELSNPDILSMMKRQDEMLLEIQQHRGQLDELMNKDLPSQRAQAEERKERNNQILCLPITERHIHHISKDLVIDWKNVSYELRLTQADVDRIDADYRPVQEKTYQALLRWRRKESSGATVGRLVTALDRVERRDVGDILKAFVSTDVSITSPPPPVCQSNIIWPCEEENQRKDKDFEASADFTSHAQTFDETLQKLHRVIQSLTQNGAHDKIKHQIEHLLEVQQSCEEIIASRIPPFNGEDSVIMQETKTQQNIRKEQAQQIRKLLEIIPAEPCQKCKVCKSCKEKRRYTHDGLKKRPKISIKPRETRSLYSDTDLTTHQE